MKRELTFEDVVGLRKEIVLNSLYYSDYENSYGVDCHAVCDFFDGYVEYMAELAEEEGKAIEVNMTWNEFFESYDTAENLEAWWYMFEECPLIAEEVEEDIA